jgi:hypothetical protein
MDGGPILVGSGGRLFASTGRFLSPVRTFQGDIAPLLGKMDRNLQVADFLLDGLFLVAAPVIFTTFPPTVAPVLSQCGFFCVRTQCLVSAMVACLVTLDESAVGGISFLSFHMT